MSNHPLLGMLTGTWHTTGHTLSPPFLQVDGTDSYEWYPGGSFLLHKVDVLMGKDTVKGLEIISYDPATGKLPMHHYDMEGRITLLQGHFSNRSLNIMGETERGTFTFSEDGNVLSGTWEKRTGTNGWEPWVEVRLEKNR